MIFLSFLLLINSAFLDTLQVLNIRSIQCFPLAIGLLVFSKARKHRRLALKDKLIWPVYLADPEFVLPSHFSLPPLIQHWSVFKLCHSYHISFLVCPPQSARGQLMVFQLMVSLINEQLCISFQSDLAIFGHSLVSNFSSILNFILICWFLKMLYLYL